MNHSYLEANARQRIAAFADAGSFKEILPPQEKLTSPHLAALDTPGAFDDGIIVGEAKLNGAPILLAAQEGDFMGGAVGEVHGAKLAGLLERAIEVRPKAVVLLVESGGVRLHEANAGLIAISEIMRAVLRTRKAGVPVVVIDGGKFGCFGGMGIVARLCDAIIVSEEGRLGLSGPEVIETTCGVEEFDSRDRALVWRTVGGKHRYILREANEIVPDDIAAFRAAAVEIIGTLEPKRALELEALEAEHAFLGSRISRFGNSPDAIDIWRSLGIDAPERLPSLSPAEFQAAVSSKRS